MKRNKYITTFESTLMNEEDLLGELVNVVGNINKAGIIFFCSTEYNLEKLSLMLSKAFTCPIIGCTTAGEIGKKYQNNGFVASVFSAEKFKFHPQFINPLEQFNIGSATHLRNKTLKQLAFSGAINSKRMFGLLLIDGISMMEESTTAMLYSAFQNLPIIGGSAGDNLRFTKTYVYHNGTFISNAAIFTVIETLMSFKTFKLQDFTALDDEMIVTESSIEERIVYEINGDTAAQEYARIIKINPENLNAKVFAMYPVMLQIGSEWYVRSIQKVNDDGSLTFYCAIDVGLPLTIARSDNFIDTLKNKVAELQCDLEDIELTLGCDCILRRLEMLEKGKQKQTESELQKVNFMGFSTFGEQYNGLHVNHTLTAVSFGYHKEKTVSIDS